MLYRSEEMENNALLEAAARMCAAARTAPKAKGIDQICTLVLTGEEKEALVRKMEEIGERKFPDGGKSWMLRDADNVRRAQAVVLIGTKSGYRGVANCGFCGFSDCAGCEAAGGNCAFHFIDLGIAIGSAVSTAADLRVDSRIMMSIGKAAMEMGYQEEEVLWQGIPVSISGKNIFFDRR